MRSESSDRSSVLEAENPLANQPKLNRSNPADLVRAIVRAYCYLQDLGGKPGAESLIITTAGRTKVVALVEEFWRINLGLPCTPDFLFPWCADYVLDCWVMFRKLHTDKKLQVLDWYSIDGASKDHFAKKAEAEVEHHQYE